MTSTHCSGDIQDEKEKISIATEYGWSTRCSRTCTWLQQRCVGTPGKALKREDDQTKISANALIVKSKDRKRDTCLGTHKTARKKVKYVDKAQSTTVCTNCMSRPSDTVILPAPCVISCSIMEFHTLQSITYVLQSKK